MIQATFFGQASSLILCFAFSLCAYQLNTVHTVWVTRRTPPIRPLFSPGPSPAAFAPRSRAGRYTVQRGQSDASRGKRSDFPSPADGTRSNVRRPSLHRSDPRRRQRRFLCDLSDPTERTRGQVADLELRASGQLCWEYHRKEHTLGPIADSCLSDGTVS